MHIVAKAVRRPVISFLVVIFLSIGFHQIIMVVNTIRILNYGAVDLPIASERELYIQFTPLGEGVKQSELPDQDLTETISSLDLILYPDLSLDKEFEQKQEFIEIENDTGEAIEKIISKTNIDFKDFQQQIETSKIQGILSNSYKQKYEIGQEVELFQFSDTVEPTSVMMTVLGFIEEDNFNIGIVPSMLEIDGSRELILLFNTNSFQQTNNHTIFHNYIFSQRQVDEMQLFVDAVDKDYQMINVKQEVAFYEKSINAIKGRAVLKLSILIGLMVLMLVFLILKKWQTDKSIDTIHRFVGASEKTIISYHKIEVLLLTMGAYAIAFLLLLVFPGKVIIASASYPIMLFSIQTACIFIGVIILINCIYLGLYFKNVKKTDEKKVELGGSTE